MMDELLDQNLHEASPADVSMSTLAAARHRPGQRDSCSAHIQEWLDNNRRAPGVGHDGDFHE
eukprot:scaffold39436_cov42-Phaeocystis_antarctica.AAC.1